MLNKKHFFHYMPLVAFLAIAFILFAVYAYNRMFQLYLVVVAGVYYFIWGILHHWIHRDLSLEVAIEYLAYAVFGVSLIFSILNLT